MPHNVAGLGPDIPFGFNTEALARLPNAAPHRHPHSAAEAAAAAAAATIADRPATPERRGSGLQSAEEERLRWLEARLSKLSARHAKVIANESRLRQQFKELAELRSAGVKVL